MADPTKPILAAPIAGWPAFVLAAVLDDALPARLVTLRRQVERGRLHPDRLAEVHGAWASVRAAGREWANWRASVDESAEGPAAEVPAGSGGEVDTTTAAAMLRVSPTRVCQLIRAGELPARRVGRMWMVDRVAVQMRKAA